MTADIVNNETSHVKANVFLLSINEPLYINVIQEMEKNIGGNENEKV